MTSRQPHITLKQTSLNPRAPRRPGSSAAHPAVLAAAACLVHLAAAHALAQHPFASRVIHFDPAPGQFALVPEFSDPARALGPPVGGGTITPDNSKLVSLGALGGSITLAFDQPIVNHPHNPFGIDLILFGNAVWVAGDPTRKFVEAATVEVSRDVNGNGLADDPFYLVLGSHLQAPLEPTTQCWDDDTLDDACPPDDPDWIPAGRSGRWTTAAYRLPDDPFAGPVVRSLDAQRERVTGYADASPTLILGDTDGDNVVDDPNLTPSAFYVVPDDPRAVGLSPGSGGGDGIDLAQAVDPRTGAPAGLDRIDFVRVTSAVLVLDGFFGEVSAEIAAAADAAARPTADLTGDGTLDGQDLLAFLAAFFQGSLLADLTDDGVVDGADLLEFLTLFYS